MLMPAMSLNPVPNFVPFKKSALYGLGEVLVSLQPPERLPMNPKCSEYLLRDNQTDTDHPGDYAGLGSRW